VWRNLFSTFKSIFLGVCMVRLKKTVKSRNEYGRYFGDFLNIRNINRGHDIYVKFLEGHICLLREHVTWFWILMHYKYDCV
jgi:hypothetical protein